MTCEKCNSTEFVTINLPDSQCTTVVIVDGREMTRENTDKPTHKISVCKKCGQVVTEH